MRCTDACTVHRAGSAVDLPLMTPGRYSAGGSGPSRGHLSPSPVTQRERPGLLPPHPSLEEVCSSHIWFCEAPPASQVRLEAGTEKGEVSVNRTCSLTDRWQYNKFSAQRALPVPSVPWPWLTSKSPCPTPPRSGLHKSSHPPSRSGSHEWPRSELTSDSHQQRQHQGQKAWLVPERRAHQTGLPCVQVEEQH